MPGMPRFTHPVHGRLCRNRKPMPSSPFWGWLVSELCAAAVRAESSLGSGSGFRRGDSFSWQGDWSGLRPSGQPLASLLAGHVTRHRHVTSHPRREPVHDVSLMRQRRHVAKPTKPMPAKSAHS